MAKAKNQPGIANTGFSANSGTEGSRLISRDGTPNLRKTGMPLWHRISLYHSLIRMRRSKFLLTVVLFYTCINVIFATAYFLIGIQHFYGTEEAVTTWQRMEASFFFSSQTLTTVGYGHVAPAGTLANFIASFESLIGILVFALVTGLFYGRFSRPKAFIVFSDHMLIAPFKEGRALMIRLATFKNNHLTDVEAVLTAAFHQMEGDRRVTKFFPLKLEISKVSSLALSWTIVHPIDEDSPLWGWGGEDLHERKLELIVAMKGFDDHFSNTVQQRTSYTHEELVYGAKFASMYDRSENGEYTILELDKVDLHHPAKLPDYRFESAAMEDALSSNA